MTKQIKETELESVVGGAVNVQMNSTRVRLPKQGPRTGDEGGSTPGGPGVDIDTEAPSSGTTDFGPAE